MYNKPSWRSSTTIIRINDGDPPLAISTKSSIYTCGDAEIEKKNKRIHDSNNGGIGYTQQQNRRRSKRGLNKSVREEDDIPLAMLAYQKGIVLDKTCVKSHRHSSPAYSNLSSSSSTRPIASLQRKRNQAADERSGRMLHHHHHRHSSPSTMQHNSHHKIKKLHPVECRSISSDTSTMRTYSPPYCSRLNEKVSCTPEVLATTLPKPIPSPKSPTCFSCFKFDLWSSCLIKKMFQKKKKISMSKIASIRLK